MKFATNDSGKLIEACKSTPEKALCPYCKGIVTLRWRRRSPAGDITYFWRHEDHANPRCPARFRHDMTT